MAAGAEGLTDDMASIHSTARELSREDWAARLVEGAFKWRSDVPAMPPADIQQITNSLHGRATMAPAAEWYLYFWALIGGHQVTVPHSAPMLDVGCGWGRMLRFFLREYPAERLAGVDVDTRLIAACCEALPGGRFEFIEPRAPLPFDDGEFGLIINNSLFSHLSSTQHIHTLSEMVRVLSPGGIMVSTIIGRRHLLAASRHPVPAAPWTSLGDLQNVLRRVDAGEFVFGQTRQGRMAEYGLAVIPDAWLLRRWGESLDVITIDHGAPGQSMVLARKPVEKR